MKVMVFSQTWPLISPSYPHFRPAADKHPFWQTPCTAPGRQRLIETSAFSEQCHDQHLDSNQKDMVYEQTLCKLTHHKETLLPQNPDFSVSVLENYNHYNTKALRKWKDVSANCLPAIMLIFFISKESPLRELPSSKSSYYLCYTLASPLRGKHDPHELIPW